MIWQNKHEQISAFRKDATKIKNDDFEWKKLEERIEINQDMINYINYAYCEVVTYWSKAALEIVLTESEEKELIDLAL